MVIPVERLGDVSAITVPVEELDADNTPEFLQAIGPVLHAGTGVVLDLSRVRFVDSSGLGALLVCLRTVQARGGALKLCGLSRSAGAAFELVRFHQLFDVRDTREEAVHAFAPAALCARP